MPMEESIGLAEPETKPNTPKPTKIAWVPLLIAMIICVGVTIFPSFLVDSQGHADHAAASALFWAMSAGFIRGVGFIPKSVILRWLFSTTSCVIGVLITLYLILH